MKTPSLILLAATLALAAPARSQEATDLLTWTNRHGRVIEAEFVGLKGDTLTLSRGDRHFTVKLSDLSAESARLAIRLDGHAEAGNPGRKVLAFCTRHLGRKVGDGQCASLAAAALDAAGASRRAPDFPAAGDYVWGGFVTSVEAERRGVRGIPSIARTRPGDIIQFRNAHFEGISPGGGTYWMRADHHTAVVESVNPAAGTVTILHQNWGRMTVKRDTLVLTDLKRGWLRFYRPQRSGR
jgi:hypothetical protein